MAAQRLNTMDASAEVLEKIRERLSVHRVVIALPTATIRERTRAITDFLESDEATGWYWWKVPTTTYFSDANTAFAFKMRFA